VRVALVRKARDEKADALQGTGLRVTVRRAIAKAEGIGKVAVRTVDAKVAGENAGTIVVVATAGASKAPRKSISKN